MDRARTDCRVPDREDRLGTKKRPLLSWAGCLKKAEKFLRYDILTLSAKEHKEENIWLDGEPQ